MPQKLRWGIMGTASFAEWLIGPIRRAMRSELVAVASRDPARAEAYAGQHAIPKAHGSYEALLADVQVDAIYMPLPNSLHCKWAVKAAQAGKHVLCEKPLVTSLSEWDKLHAAAASAKVVIFEALASLHHPQTARLKQMVQSGQLGQIRLIVGWELYCMPPEMRANFRFDPRMGGGSLWDGGVYPNSLAIMVLGAGAPVQVWASMVQAESGVDVAMAGQMRFANGVMVQIASGFESPDFRRVHIVGTQGALEILTPSAHEGTGTRPTCMILSKPDGSHETITIPAYDAYQAEVEAMEACVLDHAEPVVPLELSREFLRSVLALYESAATGRAVRL